MMCKIMIKRLLLINNDRILLLYLLMSHYIGLVLLFFSADATDLWQNQDPSQIDQTITNLNNTFKDTYLESLFFAVTTISSVGFG